MHHQIDMARVYKVRDHFKKIRPKYAEFESKTLVDTKIFDSQIPGGMLSNMESQLRAQGAADRTDEVMAMVPICRKDAGYPPLVTPSSADRGYPGRVQRPDGRVQGHDRRVRRHDRRLLRCLTGPA